LDCGWALTDAQRETNFALLKELGATAVRLSHYEHDDYTYQLADRTGIILWSEIPLVDRITESPAFYPNAKQQLQELIRQRGNHPSVICWGIFNEITMEKGPSPTNLVSQLARLVAQEDAMRPSTAATATTNANPVNWYSDLIVFNKYYGWYEGGFDDFVKWADKIHAEFPDRCIGVGEYGAGASLIQHSENPVKNPKPGGKFHPEEYQNLFHEAHWQAMQQRPYLWAKFVWNLCDFAVDGRNEGDTPGRNDKGLVTYDRQTRKDAFYFYQANWTTNPMVHITGQTFTNRQTNFITAKIYSNCEKVELFLNGKSDDVISSSNRIFKWPLELARGSNTVQAIGFKGDIQVTNFALWNFLGASKENQH
jgi:beta-galactosidase